MYTKQVEDMLKKEVENMDINKLKELALKMEKMERFSKNEI